MQSGYNLMNPGHPLGALTTPLRPLTQSMIFANPIPNIRRSDAVFTRRKNATPGRVPDGDPSPRRVEPQHSSRTFPFRRNSNVNRRRLIPAIWRLSGASFLMQLCRWKSPAQALLKSSAAVQGPCIITICLWFRPHLRLYLCSSWGASFINGAILPIDGVR